METDFTVILVIAVGLALDALAVSLAIGVQAPRPGPAVVLRVAGCFGLFQGLMPLIGWAAGTQAQRLIADYDHWVAFALLFLVGAKMLVEAARDRPAHLRGDPSRGWLLLTLGVATSIDALAVGLSLALLETPILLPALVIALVTFVLCLLGVRLGRRAARLGRAAELAGGLILWAIGARILLAHLGG